MTPSLNQGRFIERTIASVAGQRGSAAVEHLIVDGGSGDQTLEILHRNAHQVSFVSEPDRGQAHAVNKGLARARADIIGWINADDVYYPGAFEHVLRVFSQRPDVDIVYGDAVMIDELDRVTSSYPTEDWDFERLHETCYISQPTVFFRRRLVQEVGWLDESLQYCMDYDYWLRVGATRPMLRLGERLAGTRMHADTKTRRDRIPAYREIIGMLRARLGQAPVRWIYNLAFENVDAEGYDHSTPPHRLAYYHRLLWVALRLLWRERQLGREEILQLKRWWLDAVRQRWAHRFLPARRAYRWLIGARKTGTSGATARVGRAAGPPDSNSATGDAGCSTG